MRTELIFLWLSNCWRMILMSRLCHRAILLLLQHSLMHFKISVGPPWLRLIRKSSAYCFHSWYGPFRLRVLGILSVFTLLLHNILDLDRFCSRVEDVVDGVLLLLILLPLRHAALRSIGTNMGAVLRDCQVFDKVSMLLATVG